MTISTLICIIALCIYTIAFVLVVLSLYGRISKLETFQNAVDEEIPKIEHVVKTHSSRLLVNSKILYERDNELKKLEDRIHTLEVNQNIRVNNEK